MKTAKLIPAIILLLTFLVIMGSCATGSMSEKIILESIVKNINDQTTYVHIDNEELFGTWINSNYNNVSYLSAKLIFNPDSTWLSYSIESSTKSWCEGRYVITNKWLDKNRNIWYEASLILDSWPITIGNIPPDQRISRELYMISDNSNVLKGYLQDIDNDMLNELLVNNNPVDPYAAIWYRE
ncbi:MAG TPA: hypothetical protein ENI15_14595 [Spirochaetes bacterium]|nr:hypothetical protein [Spirochaetota bacterium]